MSSLVYISFATVTIPQFPLVVVPFTVYVYVYEQNKNCKKQPRVGTYIYESAIVLFMQHTPRWAMSAQPFNHSV